MRCVRRLPAAVLSLSMVAAATPALHHGTVAPVDIATTLASILRTNWSSAAVGRVLTAALTPDASQPGRL